MRKLLITLEEIHNQTLIVTFFDDIQKLLELNAM